MYSTCIIIIIIIIVIIININKDTFSPWHNLAEWCSFIAERNIIQTTYMLVGLGGLVAIVLAIGPKVRGF
jgi:hypothetical protein